MYAKLTRLSKRDLQTLRGSLRERIDSIEQSRGDDDPLPYERDVLRRCVRLLQKIDEAEIDLNAR